MHRQGQAKISLGRTLTHASFDLVFLLLSLFFFLEDPHRFEVRAVGLQALAVVELVEVFEAEAIARISFYHV